MLYLCIFLIIDSAFNVKEIMKILTCSKWPGFSDTADILSKSAVGLISAIPNEVGKVTDILAPDGGFADFRS